jgi:hypothetical protein
MISECTHFKEVCIWCYKTISQCPCMIKSTETKPLLYGICNECKGKEGLKAPKR